MRVYYLKIGYDQLLPHHIKSIFQYLIIRRYRVWDIDGAVKQVKSRDSAFGIATGYGLDGLGVGDRVPVESRIFSSHVVQTGSGAHPDSYPMGTGGAVSPGVKRPGREADHSHPTSAEAKKT
jgi:hypothetical protein